MIQYLTTMDLARMFGKRESTIRGWRLPTPDAYTGNWEEAPRQKLWKPRTIEEWKEKPGSPCEK
jgi:hypothetical protein